MTSESALVVCWFTEGVETSVLRATLDVAGQQAVVGHVAARRLETVFVHAKLQLVENLEWLEAAYQVKKNVTEWEFAENEDHIILLYRIFLPTEGEQVSWVYSIISSLAHWQSISPS